VSERSDRQRAEHDGERLDRCQPPGHRNMSRVLLPPLDRREQHGGAGPDVGYG
jgi:hypothetical protein